MYVKYKKTRRVDSKHPPIDTRLVTWDDTPMTCFANACQPVLLTASVHWCLGGQRRERGNARAAGLLALGSACEHARVSLVCLDDRI